MKKINNKNLKIKTNGFSLLELIIYIAVLAVVTMVITGIFIILNRGGGQEEARAEVNSNIRFVMERISQDLRSATSTSAITSPASTTTPSNILTLYVAGNTISYATTSNNQIRRSVNSVSEIITSDKINVSSFVFTRTENKNAVLNKTFASVQSSIKVDYKSDSPDWQYSESKKTTVSLR